MKMLRYVFIIPEIELNRGWYNFQVIITSSISSKSYDNSVNKSKILSHVCTCLGR